MRGWVQMANGIDIDKMASEIAKGLEQYSKEVVEKVNVSSKRIANEAVKKLKDTSPNKTGDYAKGWKQKEVKDLVQPNNHIVHNKTNYQLIHLLEYGHAKAGGGRVDAIPHVGKVEEYVVKEFLEEVEEDIKNG